MSEGRTLKGKELEQLKLFLEKAGLQYEDGIEYTACIYDDNYEMIATGSVEGNVLKCIAVAPGRQGDGLTGTILTQLIQYEIEQERTNSFIYTKPQNQVVFESFGFYTIMKTESILLMENHKDGFLNFLKKIQSETTEIALKQDKIIGSIVANCDPFTLGHRYLIEEALKSCDYLHLFILSDNRSFFSPEERYQMVLEGTSDLKQVILHHASDYIVSAATFPTYFMKEKAMAGIVNCSLDLELFGQKIGPALHISRRYVGTEPYCIVTGKYNEIMKERLPALGIEVIELIRKQIDGEVISASAVRYAMIDFEINKIKKFIPDTTWKHLI